MEKGQFFLGCDDITRYKLHEIIGKGSYGTVCSATDRRSGEKVAIKKITEVFENVSDAIRILREVKVLRLLQHEDIVKVHNILLPTNNSDFRDIFVIFELLETDLHQVIKANDDMTTEHHRYFIYQLLRGMKYIHTGKVFHRDLKPKNILVNSDCKLKICDFGLARPALDDVPHAVFWTDYVATRWYRAPELCGSFFTRYTPAVDIWSIGCIFAEIMNRKPLFPGKNVVHQLELITDLVGSPSEEEISNVRNEKARHFLEEMERKLRVPLDVKLPNQDPQALDLLRWMLEFNPDKRPTAAEALKHPFLSSLHDSSREPCCTPVDINEFKFEAIRVKGVDEVRHMLYEEILEYHPERKREYYSNDSKPSNLEIPSTTEQFKQQFAALENEKNNVSPGEIKATLSMPVHKVSALKQKYTERKKQEAENAENLKIDEISREMNSKNML